MPRVIALLGFLILPPKAIAQLSWEQTSVHLTAPESRRVVTAEYPFRNSGSKPIKIRRVHTNCGCTAAQLSKETYQPGESDLVRVAFHIEGRSGLQDKRIRIHTDDVASNVDLQLTVEIMPGLQISPLVLRWSSSDRSAPREARLTLPPGQDASHLRIELSAPDLAKHEILDTERPNHKRLVFTPLSPPAGRYRATLYLGKESVPLHLLFP